tara:strand:- start:30 stop:353 length:324 start_codon:yes stop_codon:yes gene_type:complete
MPPKLRYEIYLPTLYNDKNPIEARKYREIKNKLQEQFGGLSVHPATVEGSWINRETKRLFSDNCFRYEIVVDKNPENREWFENLKEWLKEFLIQYEIFMIYTEINWV